MATAPKNIPLPDGSERPQWATEETLLKLLDKFGGSSAGVGAAGGTSKSGTGSSGSAGAGGSPLESLSEMGETAKSVKKNFGDMGDATKRQSSATLALTHGAMNAGKKLFDIAGASASVDGAMKTLGSGMSSVGALIGGPWGMAIQLAAVGVTAMAAKVGEYLDSMDKMVEAGLGYSDKLGESASIAASAGLSLTGFYNALEKTGQAYRSLGANGLEAADNFGKLQTEVRDTYGTFGMTRQQLAEGSADFINVFAAQGLKGSDAVAGAAKAYGGTLETLREVSVATGASMAGMKKSMGDLLKSPIITAGLKAFGRSTEDAIQSLARGAAGMEAVFGKLGAELFKQTAEAEAAGLSIINTKLGQSFAPFGDVSILDNFQKKLKDNTVSAGEFGKSAEAMVNSMGPNIPTLRLLAQQGDAQAAQLIEMYQNAKKYTEMSTEELEAIKKKGRAEENLKKITEKMGAMMDKLSAKLFGLIDTIPISLFDDLASILEVTTDILGGLFTVVGFVLKPMFVALGFAVGALIQPFKLMFEVGSELIDMFSALTDAIFDLDFGRVLDVLVIGVKNVFGIVVDGMFALFKPVIDLLSNIFSPLVSAFNYVKDAIGKFTSALTDNWLVKKLLGGSDSSTPATTAGMSAPVSNNSAAVVSANRSVQTMQYGNQEDNNKQQLQLQQDMKDQLTASVRVQKQTADNTERTGKAVEATGAYA
jgi:hypothetical protein